MSSDHTNTKALYESDAEFRRDSLRIRKALGRSRAWRNLVLLLVVLSPLASFTLYYFATQSFTGEQPTNNSLLNSNAIAALLLNILASLLLLIGVYKNHGQVSRTLQLMEKQRDLFLEYSHTDPLTGALNRRVFTSAYRVAEAQLRRNQLPFALIALDIDHFKRVNDKYGHDAGDLVLRTLVYELQKVIRQSDIFMRMGGEEFMIISNVSDKNKARTMAEKLREAASRISVPMPDKTSLQFTISLGIHLITQDDTIESASKHVDEALYAAKAQGRNCVVVYQPGMSG